jgi:hypothetical protein
MLNVKAPCKLTFFSLRVNFHISLFHLKANYEIRLLSSCRVFTMEQRIFVKYQHKHIGGSSEKVNRNFFHGKKNVL